MGFFSWSKTAATNATADATINWAEGQSPSSVNDSARAMMARLKEWGTDIAGSIATGGSSTAYTVASNQGFDTLAHLDGAVVAFVPHVTNGATVTLNVDGLGAKPLRYGPSKELQSGVMIQGTPYVATYNNSDGAFYLRNIVGDPYGVPLGGMMPYIGTTAPNTAFVLPSGQAISRTTYATLFSLTSTTFGTGDGSTTFNLPDLRGRSIFGLDNMGGSAASRITNGGSGIVGTTLGAAGGAETVTLAQGNLPNVTLTTTIAAGQGSHSHTEQGPSGGGATSQFGFGTGAGPNNSGGYTTDPATLPQMTGTTPTGGSGTAVNKMPPAMVLPFILRVI